MSSGVVQPGGAAAGRVRPRRTRTRYSLPLLHLYFVWMLTLFELQYFLGNVVATPFLMIVHLGYPPLLLAMAFRAPVLLAQARTFTWYLPLGLFFLVGVVTIPFAADVNLGRLALIYILIYYTISVATGVYVKTARHALPIVAITVGQYAWYGIWAGVKGQVLWHPTLSNHDGFGALMVSGAGLVYWFAAAARPRKRKILLYLLAMYCVLGVVASYARAAFLSLVLVGAWIWVRSPRKLLTAVAAVVGFIAVIIGASLIFDPGFFWNEMMSAFDEGTDEGTGGERMKLWRTAIRVWMVHPILGVGGGNFGAFAAGHFRPGELADFPNPNVLYGFNLHNSYFQVLSEYGLVGVFAFCWCMVDFWKKNRDLRTTAAGQRWDERSGGAWQLKYLALGLEAANLANILGGLAYATLYMPWFFTVWAANRMLWSVTRPDGQPAGGRAVRSTGKGAGSTS